MLPPDAVGEGAAGVDGDMDGLWDDFPGWQRLIPLTAH